MNRHVHAITGRLSLRPPQRQSLEILDRVTELIHPSKRIDLAGALAAIRAEFPSVTEFEREFPSLCFRLATGVGKTRLMGAFVAYLHLGRGINNFFVLAPNLTIYDKLISDFTPGSQKYVFRGVAEFAAAPPEIITGDNFEQRGALVGSLFSPVVINIFNISKINSEVRGGKSPRIKRLAEVLGQSYFTYLAGLPDLVLLMDESHRYRASAGVRAINELKPLLGLELTATPYVETSKGRVDFRNVIYDYPLARAMADGFVKEPAVVTRKDFSTASMTADEIERIKLEDGVRLHESVKVDLETYARQTDRPIVKPFLLVIARDTSHASQLQSLIRSEEFFGGRYAERVIQVDSSKTGAEEEEMIARLLKVEDADEPTEIVIHVNMLKEGWDVTNLYTIVPLRAAHARVLIEQSIGRGLRLPYGQRTGVASVDRLNIVAHDRFQEIVDEANRPDSLIRLQVVELGAEQLQAQPATVISQSQVASRLGAPVASSVPGSLGASHTPTPLFAKPEDQSLAHLAYEVICGLERQPNLVPTLAHLNRPEVQAAIVKAVEERRPPAQLGLGGVAEEPDLKAIVAQTVEFVTQRTIGIPRIHVAPKGEVRSGFRPFTLDLSGVRYAPHLGEIFIQNLRTSETETLKIETTAQTEKRLEDHLVFCLVDFDDVSYDDHADLLYDLAGQVIAHFRTYLEDDEIERLLQINKGKLAELVHAQMQTHAWEDSAVDYEETVSRGFSELKRSAYSGIANQTWVDFRTTPTGSEPISKLLFGGFARCLYDLQKFDSDAERKLAVILDRDSQRWFRPARGQFNIFYRNGAETLEYQPDFVAEDSEGISMLEVKASHQLEDEAVQAKTAAAIKWCALTSKHAIENGGKPWRYALIPHDAITENRSLAALVAGFGRGVRDY